MSAGAFAAAATLTKRTNDLQYLAPLFREAVERAIDECNTMNQLNAIVYESYRSNTLQQEYYRRGRDVKPPNDPVTNAKTNLLSWHGYGLAVDVIHKDRGWDIGEKWFRDVARIFKSHGCKWGGDWVHADLPHFQWGKCKPSPSDIARTLIATKGVEAVWDAVGALAPTNGSASPP